MIYETKMIKVCLSGWQCYLPRLTVNLLVLAIILLGSSTYPKRTIAQVPTNESNREQAANKNTVPTTLEPKILAEINRVRTNPQNYAQWLETQRKYYDGIWLRLPGERAVRTNKGRKALEEAIAFLKEQAPLPPLETSPQASATASSELKNFATAQNIQYFSYGRKTATGIVMGLVVDDLFPDRRRRNSLLSPDAENTGVVCKSDPRYAKVCAIAYSDFAATTEVAEVKPETTKPDKNTVVNVPETITTTEASDTPETTASSEIKKPEIATTSENTDTDITTLPVPPQPQVPPVPSDTSAKQPQESAAADLEVAQADDSGELKPEVSKPEPEEISEEEIEVAEEAEIEAEIESKTEEVIEDEPTPIADEAEAESEIAEIIEEESEEVATNSSSDRLLEKVERGALEKGDRIISDDGSLYDFYPLSGKAGDTFSIYLESDQFDAFVALVDSKGNTIKENDDISEEDSNSRIRVTLPEDGTYNIIVNTYDEQGTGKYVLTVSR